MNKSEVYDVIVIGSGAAGAMAALRAADAGLSVIVIEKAHKYGGTAATSGGVMWVPGHGLEKSDDTREEVLQYLSRIITVPIQHKRLESFLDAAPKMISYLKESGIKLMPGAGFDYFPTITGSRSDRSVVCSPFDGRELKDHFFELREQYTRFKLLNRYSMSQLEVPRLVMRKRGWLLLVFRLIVRYWTDIRTRITTSRDRRLTNGAALMGSLYKKIFDLGVEVRLGTKLDEILYKDSQVTGVVVSHFGRTYPLLARYGVLLCAGGFEWNQELRNRYFPVPGDISYSATPEHQNQGEGLLAALKIGADTEHTQWCWWMPTMHKPIPKAANFVEIHMIAFDIARPHSVCVNRLGERFVNEASSYDNFGEAMLQDQLANGTNTPCWFVFDAQFRKKFSAGGYMPQVIMPDCSIPPDHWNHYIFRANTIAALADKIGVPQTALIRTVENMNRYATDGVDSEFGRGGSNYDLRYGDPSVSPNPCLGTINVPPFYAIPINLGDIGTKGGLKADHLGRVLNKNGLPIKNLYAAGNNAGSPFGNRYPGPGSTIAAAMTFSFIAVNDIVSRIRAVQGINQASHFPHQPD